jgi:hypothetical protein
MSEAFIEGAWRSLKKVDARVANAWVRVTRAERFDGTVWQPAGSFFDPLTATVSPRVAAGFLTGAGVTVTNTVTVMPQSGEAPFTYSWSRVSGDGIPLNQANATTAFEAFVGPNESKSGIFECLVTDASGQTATVTVPASFASFFDPEQGL